MDPIFGGALVSGATGIASSAMGGKAAKEAAKSQERSNAQALAFAREQEQTRKDQYSQAFNVWRNAQNIMRERYGLPPLPEMTAFPGSAAPAVGGAPGAPTGASRAAISFGPRPGGMPVAPANLGEMMQAKAAPAELGSWNDWQQYRLG